MPKRPSHDSTGWLFGQPSVPPSDDITPAPHVLAPALAEAGATLARIMPGLVLGTSSWTFPSWHNLIYTHARSGPPSERSLIQRGLSAYAKHPLFRAVGLDRTYYRPMPAAALAEYAAQVPPDFRFLVKAHNALTQPDLPRTSENADLFLDAGWCRDQVLAPAWEGLGSRLGTIVLQFSPMQLARFATTPSSGALALCARLSTFLARLRANAPNDLPLSVEVRNRALLIPALFEALLAANVSYCYAAHPTMPTIAQQAETLPEPLRDHGPLIVRWMLHRSQQYEQAKDRYFPFHALVDEDPLTRHDIASLALRGKSRSGIIIINNKAEGSAPKSVEALATELLSRSVH